jgi:hypothetical protein
MTQQARNVPFLVVLMVGVGLLCVSLGVAAPAAAQTPCPVVDSISYPIDTSQFVLVQDFAAPSIRHEGKFHTAEDWYGGRGTSYGQPVRAIATGRVKYASPLAWGRDGGVVIIEHFMPDGTVAYSQYGHLKQTDAVQFPTVFNCVQAGDVIGLITDARPAPHLHFEMRINQPDTPGPGYTWEDPVTLGWREPDRFVTNWQTWLLSAPQWHIVTGDESGLPAPPLQLNDNSLLYLDGDALKRATADGRVLWRILLGNPAVGLTGYQGSPLLIFADGTVQRVGYEGSFEDHWRLDETFDSAPLDLGDGLLFHTPDNALVAVAENRADIAWRLDDVPAIRRGHAAGQVIGLITTGNEMLMISRAGQIIDRATLRGPASLSTNPDDGSLLVYSHGGLWSVDSAGHWAYAVPWADQIPANGGSGAALIEANRVYVFDGTIFHAYDRDGMTLWETPVSGVSGAAELSHEGTALLLTSTHGDIVALGESGTLCASTRVFGDDRSALLWHQLGEDGTLRLAVSNQLLGLNWNTFTAGCG